MTLQIWLKFCLKIVDKWAEIFLESRFFKPLNYVDCRLETSLRCICVDRNLRFKMKIVDFQKKICHSLEQPNTALGWYYY